MPLKRLIPDDEFYPALERMFKIVQKKNFKSCVRRAQIQEIQERNKKLTPINILKSN